jgi:hypothetical protein
MRLSQFSLVSVAILLFSVSALAESGTRLGPQGIDDRGRTGRLHTVATGDTLWDLSAAYLGTPWVWPSVWIDNGDIANPHLILPGDKIWITANEMRVVSDAEAEAFLEPLEQEAVKVEPIVSLALEPAVAALGTEPEEPSTREALPVVVPGAVMAPLPAGREVTIARRQSFGFVSADDMIGASTIVDSTSERTYLAAGDPVYVGMGEGDVRVGDQFMAFDTVEEVRDPATRRILGHHVEILGWIEVSELTGDTSVGQIRESFGGILRGARVIPRTPVSRRVTVKSTPDMVAGEVVFLPSDLTLVGDGGYVYLNRGELHGVEVGSELEIFDSGRVIRERERHVDVRTPDQLIATLVVVTVEPETSVAFVLNASRELEVGDPVRPARPPRLARR